MDDFFCTVEKTALSAFILHVSSIEFAIQFTTKKEVHSHFPFLDTLVKCDYDRMSFTVFRNDAHTGICYASTSAPCMRPVMGGWWLPHLYDAMQKHIAQPPGTERLIWLLHAVACCLWATPVRLSRLCFVCNDWSALGTFPP